MNLLFDPNVAYLLLVIGLIVAILALFAPGTGVLEVGAIFMLFLAGYGIFNLLGCLAGGLMAPLAGWLPHHFSG